VAASRAAIRSLCGRSTRSLDVSSNGRRCAKYNRTRLVMIFRIQAALIAGGFTIAGVLLGAFLTFHFAGRLAKASARRDAGRRLREAFAIELAAMDAVGGVKDKDIEHLLQSAFPKHRTAVTEFAFYLSPPEREALERAWRNYFEVGAASDSSTTRWARSEGTIQRASK